MLQFLKFCGRNELKNIDKRLYVKLNRKIMDQRHLIRGDRPLHQTRNFVIPMLKLRTISRLKLLRRWLKQSGGYARDLG